MLVRQTSTATTRRNRPPRFDSAAFALPIMRLDLVEFDHHWLGFDWAAGADRAWVRQYLGNKPQV